MKKNVRNYENLNKFIFEGVGDYGIPALHPESFEVCQFIGFNYASSFTKEDRRFTGIHFFLDDYQFQRVWNMPDYYLPLLKQYKYIMSPDFSTYCDFPKAIQIYNHYRKHWIGAYLQMHGIKVIPTISWSDEESFEWCFDGEPTQSTVAISSIGCNGNQESRELFIRGYNEMLRRLEPKSIIFYGDVPSACKGSIVKVTAFQDKWKEAKCGW